MGRLNLNDYQHAPNGFNGGAGKYIYIGQEVEGQEQLGERDKDAGEPWTSCPSCRKDDEDGLKLRVKRVFPWSTSCLFMCDDSFRCFLVNWDISLSCNSRIPCATSIIIPTRTEVYIQAKKCSTTFFKLVIHSISCSSASTPNMLILHCWHQAIGALVSVEMLTPFKCATTTPGLFSS
jgi:hypothetical protein